MDAGKDAIANTRAICLGCGRHSTYRLHPSTSASASRPNSPPPNSFLPALNSGVMAGPDIYRGGFRLPVRVSSPSYKKAFVLDDGYQVRVQGQSVPSGSGPGSGSGSGAAPGAGNVAGTGSGRTGAASGPSPQDLAQSVAGTGPYGFGEATDNEASVVSAQSDTMSGFNIAAAEALPLGSSQGGQGGPGGFGISAVSAGSGASAALTKRGASASTGSSGALARQTGLIQGAGQGQGPKQQSKTGPIQAQGQTQDVLPIFRKGFPGKKSLRAEVSHSHPFLLLLLLINLKSTSLSRPQTDCLCS